MTRREHSMSPELELRMEYQIAMKESHQSSLEICKIDARETQGQFGDRQLDIADS